MGARITVVIVTFRSSATIAECLASLGPAAADAGVRAVVVDNYSGDGTATAVRNGEWPVPVDLVERDTNGGFAVGASAGLERASGDYVLFLNPDAVLPPAAIDQLVAVAEARPAAAVVTPALVNVDGTPQAMVEDDITFGRALRGLTRLGPPVRPQPAPESGPPLTVDWAHAACFLMPLDRARRLRGFDERFFFGGEDMDLCRRARAAGFEVVVVPEVRVRHAGGASVDAARSSRDAFRVHATATAFAIRYGPAAARAFALAALAVHGIAGHREQAAAAAAVLRGRPPKVPA